MEDQGSRTKRAFKPSFQALTCKVTEIPLAAACLADTFLAASNPAYRRLFVDSKSCCCRRVDLHAAYKWLFVKRLELLLDNNCPIRIARDSETGAVLAVSCAIAPDRRPTLGDQIRAGLLTWPFRFGIKSFLTLLSMDDALGTTPDGHWQLAMVATRPEAQGQGLAARLIDMVMEDIRGEERRKRNLKEHNKAPAAACALVHLDTQREYNTSFYSKRWGFTVTEVRDVPVSSSSSSDASSKATFRSWTMLAKLPL